MHIRPYRLSDLEVLRSLTEEAFQGVSIDQNIKAVFGTIAGHDWRWRKARHIDQTWRSIRKGCSLLRRTGIGRHLYPACGFREVARQIHFVMKLNSETQDVQQS